MMRIESVVKTYDQHLHIGNNKHLIYLPLATYVTRTLEGDPAWLTGIGASGCGKTTMIKPWALLAEDDDFDIEIIDTLTKKALITGQYGRVPVVQRLNNRDTMIIISDLATILCLTDDDKREILSQLRTVFDGKVKIDSGSTEPQVYNNIHASLIGFSTPYIRRDLAMGTLMGTREILYTLPKYNVNIDMAKKNLTRAGTVEIANKLKDFLNSLTGDFVLPNEAEEEKLWQMATRIAIWRVEGIFDGEGYLAEPVEKEVPKRLFVQLRKLWIGFNRIGLDNEAVWEQLNHIEAGTGNPLRTMLNWRLRHFLDSQGWMEGRHPVSLKKLAIYCNVGEREALRQLMVLKSLGCVEGDDYTGESEWQAVDWEEIYY